MKNGELTLYSDSKPCGRISVALKFDIPDELMDALLTRISRAVNDWTDMVIAYGNKH